MPNKLPQNIFFDLGNVVIPIDFDRVCKHFIELGGDAASINAQFSLKAPMYPQFIKYELGEVTIEQLTESFNREFMNGGRLTVSQIEDGLCALLLPIPTHRVDFIRQLKTKGFQCHVISNNTALHTRKIKETFSNHHGQAIDELFGEVIMSQEVGLRKPSKEIYLYALDKVRSLPQDSLMIDDLEANLDGARAVGMHTLHVRSDQDVVERLKEEFSF